MTAFSEHATAHAEAAWQRLGPGIDLFNLLMADQVLAGGAPRAAAWDALRGATVLAHAERLEDSVRDVDGLASTLEVLLADEGVPLAESTNRTFPAPPWATGDAEPLMQWLAALSALAELLRTGEPQNADPGALWQAASEARARLDTPQHRRVALEAVEALLAERLRPPSPKLGSGA